MVTSALSFSEVECEKPMVLCYSFNSSNIVFQSPLSPFSRKTPLFFPCVNNFISDNYFILYIIFDWSILAAGMHPDTHRYHLVLKFKHCMPTARADTHSLGIFMQLYGQGQNCDRTSSSRTLRLSVLSSCSES